MSLGVPQIVSILYHIVVLRSQTDETVGVTLSPGAVVQDRYQIVRLLGRGGMATAYLVHDQLWDTEVALKLLETPTAQLREAFHFEFGVLRGLHHPRLSQVHDFGVLDSELTSKAGSVEDLASPASSGSAEVHFNPCFYTSDFVPGTTLDAYARGASWQRASQPLCDALGALRLLHTARFRHGDFKPANVLVDPSGRGVLIDLSCAAALTRHGRMTTGDASISGTPGFLAPEVLSGTQIDERADLYAVGVTLDQMVSVLDAEAPREVHDLARRLTQTNPEKRPADVDEVLEVLGVEPTLIHPAVAIVSRFVGRQAELDAAGNAQTALLDGTAGPRVLHIVGDSGTGRSGLLREIKWRAQQQCRVIECNANAAEAMDRLVTATLDAGEGVTEDGPSAGGLAAMLAARESLVGETSRPVVWIVDDADQLEPSQQELLLGLCRVLEPTDSGLLVVSSLPELELPAPGLRRLELGPLTPAQIEHWVGDSLAKRSRAQLAQLSGGSPATLRSVLGQIGSGQLSEEELERVTDRSALSRRRSKIVASLGEAGQRALGLLALLGGVLRSIQIGQLEIPIAALDELVAVGQVECGDGGWKLICGGQIDPITQALPPGLITELHREVAEWLGGQLAQWVASAATEPIPTRATTGEAASLAARQVLHLALADDRRQAAKLLVERANHHGAAPVAWWRAACAVADGCATPAVQLATARLEQAAGHPSDALARLSTLLAAQPAAQTSMELHIELGSCHLELGHSKEAKDHLEHVRTDGPNAAQRGRSTYLLARSLLQHGAYGDAARLAEQGLEDDVEPPARADLLETAGVALSFQGDLPGARRRLDEAATLLQGLADPRRSVRAHGNRALVAYNLGDLGAALKDYRSAVALAEQHGLSDLLATAALNLATACHQSGQWADALSLYLRGLRIAVALGQLGNEALIRFNLAKLQADLGLFDRAKGTALGCREIAERAAIPMLDAAAETVCGEVAAAQGQPGRARQHFVAARAGLSQHGSLRDQAEVDIQLAALLIRAEELEQAAALLDQSEAQLQGADAQDVECRLAVARGRLALAHGRSSEAASLAEGAAQIAGRLGQHDLEAECEQLLGQAWAAQGAATLADQHGQRARALWERTAAPLTTSVRDAFWRHPRRAGLGPAVAPSALVAAPLTATREHRLELLLKINQRLNSSLRSDEVLELTMDAAIELTGAERGFVLLAADTTRAGGPTHRKSRPDRDLHVAVARNLDREALDPSHLELSRGIAEQVMRTGEPLVTGDAQTDGRFHDQASVHAMHLKSVICVPVAGPAGVLGALYLDNRFQRGHFTELDIAGLRAFGDQVAIALTNAQLHDDLRQRNRELETERRRVEALVQGQAAEIDRLTEEAKRHRITRQYRFDYSAIVATSPAMDAVFALLDRVIDTELPILIQGDSGTGKELIARAIHLNSPRSKGPLVTINCGALPESLLESELFGYERGAFTGADRARDGLVVQARGGTLFLDELGEMPRQMQVKLLRVLQEREVQPLGSAKVIPVDFRLVCATNRRLRDEVEQGSFREDLFYRISAVEVTLPPLSDRAEDIPPLAAHMLTRVAEQLNRQVPELTAQALRKLAGFDWPGNVRQLEHVITKAVALSEGARIHGRDIDLPAPLPSAPAGLSRAAFERTEIENIAASLAENRWNVTKVARLLGIPRPTLYRRIKRHGLLKKDRSAKTS